MELDDISKKSVTEKGDDDADESSTPDPPALPLGKRIRQKITSVRWRAMLTTCMIVGDLFIMYASISQIGLFFPVEAVRKGVPLSVTGVIVGITPLAMAIFLPIAGYLIPILTIPFSIIFGLLLVGTVYIALGMAIYLPSAWSFVLVCLTLRFVEGVGSALFHNAGYTLVTYLYPESAGTVVGVIEVGAGSGYAIGPVIGGLLYQVGGYKLPFVSIGGLYFVLAFLIFLVLTCVTYPQKITRQLLHIKTVFALLKNFIIMLLVLSASLTKSVLGFLGTTFALFLEDHFGLTAEQVAFVFLANSVPYIFFAPFSGWLGNKINPIYILMCGQLISGVGLLLIGPTTLIPITPKLWLTVLGVAGAAAGAGQVTVASFSTAFKISIKDFPELAASESERAKMISVISGIINAGLAFGEFSGPIIGGTLTEYTGFRTTSSLIGESILAVMILLMLITLVDYCLSSKCLQQNNDQKDDDNQ